MEFILLQIVLLAFSQNANNVTPKIIHTHDGLNKYL